MGAAVQHGILQVESRLGICRNLCRSVQRFVGDLGQCGVEGLERLGQFRVVAVEAFSVAAVGGAGIVKCEAVVDVYGLVIERTVILHGQCGNLTDAEIADGVVHVI